MTARSLTLAGRTYTVVYEVSDPSGNAVEVTGEVRVPHDRGGAP